MSDTSCVNTNSAGFTDRFVTIGTSDTILPVACWEACGPCSGIGVDEEHVSWKVYPNPVQDLLIIEHSADGALQVEVYNALGQVVRNTTAEGALVEVNLANLPAGMYYVKLTSDEFEQTTSITKE